MFLRASFLVVFMAAICAASDVPAHQRFESKTVVNPHDSFYLIRCEGIDFRNEATVVSVRLIDAHPRPQFETFRRSQSSHRSSAYIEIPTSFRASSRRLTFLRYEDPPAVLYHPAIHNKIREVELRADFEPLPNWSEEAPHLHEVDLKFAGFSPFTVVKVEDTAFQEQAASNDLRNSVILASMMIAGVLFAVCAGVYLAKDWKLLASWFQQAARADKPLASSFVPQEQSTMAEPFVLPQKWDKESIAVEIRNLQNRPTVLGVLTRSLVDRFVIGQDDKTATMRIAYLRTKLEELKVSKELQGELDDLQFRESELEIRRLKMDADKGTLEHQRKTQQELREAEHRRDLLKVKAESAALEKQIRELEHGDAKPKEPSPAQAIRDRIQRLREERAYARETIKDPSELRRTENLYDDKMTQLEDELRKVL